MKTTIPVSSEVDPFKRIAFKKKNIVAYINV